MYFKTCSTNEKLVQQNVIDFNSMTYENVRHEAMRIRSKSMTGRLVGSKNGMFGRKRTAEEKKKISETRTRRGVAKGDKNPMYGKPCYHSMTDKERARQKESMRKTMKSRNFRNMYDPVTSQNIKVLSSDVQRWLDIGYVLGQCNKSRRSTKGMKKVCLPVKDAKQVWIRSEEVQRYLENGYVLWKDRLK